MKREIDGDFVRVLRIHVSGDFYDAAYTAKWTAIARACPHVTFFAYTRSWRIKEILPSLVALAALPNVHLWFSEDRDSGPSPAVPGVRRAFLVVSEEDEALVPPEAALVFRDRRHELVRDGQVKRIGGVLVCPVEQGNGMDKRVTCSTCRLCFR